MTDMAKMRKQVARYKLPTTLERAIIRAYSGKELPDKPPEELTDAELLDAKGIGPASLLTFRKLVAHTGPAYIPPQIKQFWKDYIQETQPAFRRYLGDRDASFRKARAYDPSLELQHYVDNAAYDEFLEETTPAVERLVQRVALYRAGQKKGWRVE